MCEIVLTGDQADAVRNAAEQIILFGPDGSRLGYVVRDVSDEDKEDITEALKTVKSPGRKYTTEQVLAHLDSLAPPESKK